jgi:hypothetical protein
MATSSGFRAPIVRVGLSVIVKQLPSFVVRDRV